MWIEVWIGEWLPLDPTFGGDFFDATHIKMGESSLNDAAIASSFVNVLLYTGKIELEIIEYRIDGQLVKAH
jgi:hypothetical protein